MRDTAIHPTYLKLQETLVYDYLLVIIVYLPSQTSGFSLAVSLRNWNWRMLSMPTTPNAWRVETFCPLVTLTDFRLQYTEI